MHEAVLLRYHVLDLRVKGAVDDVGSVRVSIGTRLLQELQRGYARLIAERRCSVRSARGWCWRESRIRVNLAVTARYTVHRAHRGTVPAEELQERVEWGRGLDTPASGLVPKLAFHEAVSILR